MPGVYAIGDVNEKFPLAHIAYRQAEVAVKHILGKEDRMEYHAVPSVIYTSPEIASVGETEESAAAKGIVCRTTKLPMVYAGRYVAETERTDGFIKLVVDEKRERIIGAHLFGLYASEIVTTLGLMIENEIPLSQLKRMIFPHPTVSEIIREVIFAQEE